METYQNTLHPFLSIQGIEHAMCNHNATRPILLYGITSNMQNTSSNSAYNFIMQNLTRSVRNRKRDSTPPKKIIIHIQKK